MGFLKKDSSLNEKEILAALNSINDPDLKQDIVRLGSVNNLKINAGKVTLTIKLTNPACPIKDQIKMEAENIIKKLNGVTDVSVSMDFEVTSQGAGNIPNMIPKVRNTIAVASGKGGVGKSTIAANLASALMKCGARVGLMDADVYGPSIPTLMGDSQKPQITENRIIPPVIHNVKMISMGYFLPKEEAVIWRGPMLHKMIQQFLGEVEWGDLDYLVIDLPPGTGDIQLSLCQTIPLTGAVIVSTPQDLALQVASKAIAMFRKLKTPILGLVENMSFYVCSHCGKRDDIFSHGGTLKASQELNLPFLGAIPLSTEIRRHSDEGHPTALTEENPYSKAFRSIASSVASQISITNYRASNIPSIEISN